MTVRVRTTTDGRKLPGRVALAVTATAARGAVPIRDRDAIVLRCLPRTDACPAR